MIDFLIKSIISLIVFLLFYYLFLEHEKMHQFKRFYLLTALLISSIIPFVNVEIIEIIPVVHKIEPEIIEKVSVPIEKVILNQEEFQLTSKQNLLPYLLWGIYTSGLLIMAFRFGKNCIQLINKTKSNHIIKYKNAKLVLVNEKTLPYTFLNAIYVNNKDYYNNKIEEELFTHELVHVIQKHTIDILFIEILLIVFWFNPILIIYKKAIQLNHEFLADEEIVKTYKNVPLYQNLLLNKGIGTQEIYLTSNLNYLVTKKRFIMMTKSTSRKITLLKKISVIPILVGLIYFFCIKITAQEKTINTFSEIDKREKYKITDKDKIRDRYYSGVYVKINDELNNRNEVTLYENLSIKDKRKYLDFVPEMMIENEIPQPLFEKMTRQNMAVWINGKLNTKEEIKKYKRNDFSYYTYSFVQKNARSKKFPQEYQYNLYTKEFFDENLKNSHLHFSGDTIKIGYVSFNSAIKKTFIKHSKADKVVWPSNEKNSYNLYVNENKTKKVIVIDAGHGGKDHGKKVNDVFESEIVEKIAKKIKLLNANNNIEIVLLREDDSFISLNDRVNKINEINPDMLISLHINTSSNVDQNGVHAYVSSENEFYEKSLLLANKMIDNISKYKLNKGDTKDANLYVLKNSKCPAVTLEIGYLTNDNDREYLTSENGVNEITNSIINFLNQ